MILGFLYKYNKQYSSSKTASEILYMINSIYEASKHLNQPKEWSNIRIINNNLIQVGSGRLTSLWEINIVDGAISISTKPTFLYKVEFMTLIVIELIMLAILFMHGINMTSFIVFVVICFGTVWIWYYIRFKAPYKTLDKAIRSHLI